MEFARKLLLPLSVALALAHLLFIFVRWDGSADPLLDYTIFWRVARAPLDHIYGIEASPFINPPTALIWLKPLSLVPRLVGYALWTTVSVVSFYLVSRRFFPFYAVALAFISPIIVKGMLLGQMSLMLSAATLAGFTASPLVGGAIIGIVATIKPQMIVLAPLALLVSRDWRRLLASVAAGCISIILAVLLFGLQPWLDWVASFPAWSALVAKINVLQYSASPAGYAQYFGLPTLPFLLLGIALGVGLVWSARVKGAELAALVVAGSVLSAPYALPHDLALLVPAALVWIRRQASIPATMLYASLLVPIALMLSAALRLAERLGLIRAGEGEAPSSRDLMA